MLALGTVVSLKGHASHVKEATGDLQTFLVEVRDDEENDSNTNEEGNRKQNEEVQFFSHPEFGLISARLALTLLMIANFGKWKLLSTVCLEETTKTESLH